MKTGDAPAVDAKEISSRIERAELVDWRKIRWFQGGLKEATPDSLERLKSSLRENSFLWPFGLWKPKKGAPWILDGHFRQRAMTELEEDGWRFPDKLLGVFIHCDDEADAASVVLVLSSNYANVTATGFRDFLDAQRVEISALAPSLSIPGFNLDEYLAGGPRPPEGFRELDGNLETKHTCPKCGYQFS